MTYNKPNDKSYTDMCIYFDAHIYDDPLVRSDELLYQYLYHIIYMLSCKAKYFEGPNSWKKYDEFALYAATKIYLRYTTHTDPASRIKSVLNYCKNLLYPMKVDWQKETFNEIIGSREINDSCYDLQTSLENSVQASYCNNEELIEDILRVFTQLDTVIYKVVDRTPYKANPILRHRIAMSILLTLVNQTTLPTSLKDKPGEVEAKYNLLKKSKPDTLILWRLGESFFNLIHVLTAEVKKECSNMVGMVRADYELADEDVTAILMTAYGNVARDDNEEF